MEGRVHIYAVFNISSRAGSSQTKAWVGCYACVVEIGLAIVIHSIGLANQKAACAEHNQHVQHSIARGLGDAPRKTFKLQ